MAKLGLTPQLGAAKLKGKGHAGQEPSCIKEDPAYALRATALKLIVSSQRG